MHEKPTYEELKQRVRDLEAVQSELQESRNKYQTLFEAANDAMFVASAETGIILDANQKAEQLIGRPRSEIIGMHQTALHPEAQKTYSETAFQRNARPKKAVFYDDFLIQHADGQNIPVEISQSFIEVQGTPCVLGIFRDVTEKQEWIETLQRHEAVIKAATDPVYYVDREYIYRVVNDAYLSYSGRPRDAIIGHPVWEILGNDKFENVIRPNMDRCFEGKSVCYEEWFSFPDGIRKYIEVYQYPVFNDAGDRVVGAAVFARDHTPRIEAEQALKESEERFRIIFEQAAAGIATVMPDGRIVAANRALSDMLGHTREELCRLSLIDITHPEDWEREYDLIQAITEGCQDLLNIEKRYLHKDGRVIWANLSSNRLRDEAGNIRYAIGVVVDITKRKQAEQALKKSEEHLRLITENLPAIVSHIDKDLTCLFANNAYLTYCGVKPEELIGKKISEILDKDAVSRAHPRIQKALKGEFVSMENHLIREDGQGIFFQVNFVPHFEANEVVGYFVLGWDITDRKQAEAALQKSLAEKEVLLREIHHRVKNNMQTIIGLLRMHARRTDDAHITEIFNDCRDRVGAMSLIHEALYQSDNLARIDFEAYLKKLCRNLTQAHDAPRRGITLTTSSADVSLDMDQGVAVGMIIAELISNAFKHAFPNDESGTVAVNLDRPDGETVRIVISDTGKGLPADFDIGNPSSLGMRLVSGAVTRELGGSIKATSDGGAQFVIRFKCPLCQ